MTQFLPPLPSQPQSQPLRLAVALLAVTVLCTILPASLNAAVSLERKQELEMTFDLEQLLSEDKDHQALIEQQRRQAEEDKFRQHIQRNSITHGMKAEHVRQSWGEPSEIQRPHEDSMRWIYHRGMEQPQTIYFHKGRVSSLN